MEKKKVAVPLVCHGHSRPVVDLFYSPVTPDGYFLISASKGRRSFPPRSVLGVDWVPPLNVTRLMDVACVVLARVISSAIRLSATN
jgi:hypothetical protein